VTKERRSEGGPRREREASAETVPFESRIDLTPRRRSPEEPPPAAPEMIGPYRVLGVLGEGGMGTVYEAEQTEPVRRRVALKVIKLGMDSREVLARFELERRALAAMSHHCIAKVLEAGTTERGQPYFVMELVVGLPIVEHCDRHRLSLDERIALFRQVCAGVQHAHQKGVVHRDLKPGNLLVVRDGDQGVPKIVDFGLAKAFNRDLLARTVYTEREQIMGTPEYMSPEQAAGDLEAVDTRTDIYSLGVVLYELLSGEKPFPSQRLRTAGWAEIQRVLAEEQPPKPSSRVSTPGADEHARRRRVQPSVLKRKLRGDLDWVVLKTIAKEPERRYESAAALSADLGRYLANEPVLAGPPGAAYRLRKFAARHRGGLAAIAAALLLAGGWLVTSTALYVRAEELRVEAESRAEEAERVADFLEELFEYASPDRALGESIPVGLVLEQGARRIEHELHEAPAIRARLLARLGVCYGWLGEYEKAERFYREAAELQEGAAGADDPATLHYRLNLAGALSGRRDAERAEAIFADLRGRIAHAAGERSSLMAAWYDALAAHHNRQGAFSEALDLAQEAVERRADLGTPPLDDGGALNELAVALFGAGRFDQARARFVEAAALYPAGHPRLALIFQNLARCFDELGQHDDALRSADRALREAEHAVGGEHPLVATVLVTQASVLRSGGRDVEAEAPLRRSLAILERALPGHTNLAWTLSDLGNLLAAAGRYTEARDLLERALAIYAKLFPGGHLHRAITMDVSAHVYLELGDARTAEQRAIASVDMLRRVAPGTPALARGLQNLALVYLDALELDRAEGLVRESLELLEGGAHDWDVGRGMRILARVHCHRRDGLAGEETARESLRLLRGAGPEDHALIADALHKLGWALALQGHATEAEAQLSESVAMYRRVRPEGHAWTVWPLRTLLAILSDPAAALPFAEECVAISRRGSPQGPLLPDDLARLAALYAKLGRLDDAAPLFEEVVQLERARSRPTALLGRALFSIARVEEERGELDAALQHADEALAELAEMAPPGSPDLLEALGVLGSIEARVELYESAEEHLTRAYEGLRDREGVDAEIPRGLAARLVELYEAWGKPESAAAYRGD